MAGLGGGGWAKTANKAAATTSKTSEALMVTAVRLIETLSTGAADSTNVLIIFQRTFQRTCRYKILRTI